MLKEFKEFISRGNAMDLAVGVIIGGAFGKIVNSLVEDILMPLIGTLLGGVNFTELTFKIGNAVFSYGKFIQAIIDFLIIAFVVFIIVKAINQMRKKPEEAPAPPSNTEVLLTEIRDLLKSGSK